VVAATGAAASAVAASAAGAWSVELTGAASEDEAERAYSKLKRRHWRALGRRNAILVKTKQPGQADAPWYRIRVDTDGRAVADEICAGMTAKGDGCTVVESSALQPVSAPR